MRCRPELNAVIANVRRIGIEKRELICLVEGSDLPCGGHCRELRVNRSTFYARYARYWRAATRTGFRVPARFVQKYRLRARLEPSGPREAVEGRTGYARELGDGSLGNAQRKEAPDVASLPLSRETPNEPFG